MIKCQMQPQVHTGAWLGSTDLLTIDDLEETNVLEGQVD